jgi:DGQHR domain-containing protein
MVVSRQPTGRRQKASVSLIKQGETQFYTCTLYSDVLARTCKVTTRKEDPQRGFQRELDVKRARDIAAYIKGGGTIPNSIVLSAQPEADLKIVGAGKTLEFDDVAGAFLVLDGQHRVYGFQFTEERLRVPVVIYNGLTREQETRLFIDINTKQRPVPTPLLLDIKSLANIETEQEASLREIFDEFHTRRGSALAGLTSPSESQKHKITRVTFNQSVKPLLEMFVGRESDDIFVILNAYLKAADAELTAKIGNGALGRPVIFRAMVGFFPIVAQRVQDRFSGKYSPKNFSEILQPVFANLPVKRLSEAGTDWAALRDYFEDRLKKKIVL